jgi:MFS family permease
MLIAYGLAIGTVGAFVIPTRDALLSDVAGDDMMRAVSGLILAQWGSQAFGSLAGSSARFIGTTGALAIPACLFLIGVPLLLQLPRPAPRPVVAPVDVVQRNTLREIGEGLRIVLHSPVLRPVLLLVIAVGLLFIGPFMVVMPLLVRDVYGGGVGQLGLLLMAFPVGTILGSSLLLWRGGVRRKGRAQLFALASGALALGTVALGLPFAGTLVAICAWGLSAAIFMSAGRTLFQEAAPMSHRGRVLSVFSLGFMGSGPLGALISGLLVGRFGELTACGVSAGAMLAVALFAALFSGVARLE